MYLPGEEPLEPIGWKAAVIPGPVGIEPVAYRGGVGVFKPPPRNSERLPKLCETQPDLWKLLEIAEFRTPTPQDVRKKGSKILKLPRFVIVLH